MAHVFFTDGAVALWTVSVCLLLWRLVTLGLFDRCWLLVLATTLHLVAGIGMALLGAGTVAYDRSILLLSGFSQPFLIGATVELFGDGLSDEFLEQNRRATLYGTLFSLTFVGSVLFFLTDARDISLIARSAGQTYSVIGALAVTVVLGVASQLRAFVKTVACELQRLRALYVSSIAINLIFFGIVDGLTPEQTQSVQVVAILAWAVVNLVGVASLTTGSGKISVSSGIELD